MKILISEIKIGDRFRKDLGDLGPLMDSIKRHGLLHPVVINDDKSLICGRRRIAAYEALGIMEIDANIINLVDLSGAEADENIVRKNFTVSEIAEVDERVREKFEAEARSREKKGRKLDPSENYARGKSAKKIAAMVGVTDRTLEKIRTIKKSSTEGDFTQKIWQKVADGKMKVDRGYNQVRRFQRIKEAEKLALSSSSNLLPNSNFDLQLGPMQDLGEKISTNSIDMIFTDPPYKRPDLYLYGDLAKLAQRVLKPGGSLVAFIGHYAIFEINDLIRNNSDLIFHWPIIVVHTGRISRMDAWRVWAYHKPLLWYYKPVEGNGHGHGPTMYQDVADVIPSKAKRRSRMGTIYSRGGTHD